MIENFYDELFMTQYVTFPTIYKNEQIPSLLDLILSTDQNMVSDPTSLPPLGKCDHVVISFEVLCYYSVESFNVPKYLYGCGDYISMTQELLGYNYLKVNVSWVLLHHWSVS